MARRPPHTPPSTPTADRQNRKIAGHGHQIFACTNLAADVTPLGPSSIAKGLSGSHLAFVSGRQVITHCHLPHQPQHCTPSLQQVYVSHPDRIIGLFISPCPHSNGNTWIATLNRSTATFHIASDQHGAADQACASVKQDPANSLELAGKWTAMAWHPTQAGLCTLAASDMTVRLVQLPEPGRPEESRSPDQVPIVGSAWHLEAPTASAPTCADLQQELRHPNQKPSLHEDCHMAWTSSGHTVAASCRADLWLLHLHTRSIDQQTPHADKAQAPEQQSIPHCSQAAFDQHTCWDESFRAAHTPLDARQQRSLPRVHAQQQLLLGGCPITALRAADDGTDAFLAATAPPLQTDAARQPALRLRLPPPPRRPALELPGAARFIAPVGTSPSDRQPGRQTPHRPPGPPHVPTASTSSATPARSQWQQQQQQQSCNVQQPDQIAETRQTQQMPQTNGHGLNQDSPAGLAGPGMGVRGRGLQTSAKGSEALVLLTAADPPASLTSQLFAECAQVLDQPDPLGACHPEASPAPTDAASAQALSCHQPGSAASLQQGATGVLRPHDAGATAAISQPETVQPQQLHDPVARAKVHWSSGTSRLACRDDCGDPAGQAQQSQIWIIEAVQGSSSMRQEASSQQPAGDVEQAAQDGSLHQRATSGWGLVTHVADVDCRVPDLLEVCKLPQTSLKEVQCAGSDAVQCQPMCCHTQVLLYRGVSN